MATKVLIIDDAARMRALLSEVIHGATDLELVGAVGTGPAAREMIQTSNPDVLVLDVEMPKMDGLDFLSSIMRLRPIPVVMVSSYTGRSSDATLHALELGAVDYFSKPRQGRFTAMETYAEEVRDKIRTAAAVGVRSRTIGAGPARTGGVAFATGAIAPAVMTGSVIAVGASTGGTEAIKDVLAALPPEMPPIVMVQHMPESFTPSFARRLDGLSRLTVSEARGGERLEPGHAYLAPGHSHMTVKRIAGAYYTELHRTEPVNRHRPAVDVLFHSVAEQVGKHAVGVILTGMGKDGAQGLLAMRRAGAWNIGQDQASCVVYGMPREAALVGAVDEVAAVTQIAERIFVRLRQMA
jgi:two-component system chemotaxis response regulator CheB